MFLNNASKYGTVPDKQVATNEVESPASDKANSPIIDNDETGPLSAFEFSFCAPPFSEFVCLPLVNIAFIVSVYSLAKTRMIMSSRTS